MRILFAVNHPSQYYILRRVSEKLKEKGNNVLFCAKDKDILIDLFENDNISYKLLSKKGSRKSKLSFVFNSFYELLLQDINLYKEVKVWKPDIMVGTDISIAHIGSLLKISSYVINEDDYDVNKLFCRFTYPFANKIISPNVCSVGKFSEKKIGYEGYQKLAYLHPNNFSIDKSIVDKYAKKEEYVILRLVALTAGHDFEGNHSGLSNNIVDELISLLETKYNVFITSEAKLNSKYDKYLLKIKPTHIHHLLAGASLLVSDSQSMSVEAAMLGVPSIRYSSFVGKISVLEELENKYQLTFGVSSNNSNKLLEKVKEILSLDKEIFTKRKEIMLKDKIDFAEFLVDIILQK